MRPIVNMPEEDRATDIGNMHKKFVKIAREIPEIYCRTDRQRDRQAYSTQYLATAPAGEVNLCPFMRTSATEIYPKRMQRTCGISGTLKARMYVWFGRKGLS